jgi:hypothetical protein
VLIQADSEAEAFAKAEDRGRDEAGDDEGTFRWDSAPARWVFAGVRKLVRCEDDRKRPGDGTEITYNELEFGSPGDVETFANGEAVKARFAEVIEPASRNTPTSVGRRNSRNGVRASRRR